MREVYAWAREHHQDVWRFNGVLGAVNAVWALDSAVMGFGGWLPVGGWLLWTWAAFTISES